MDLTAIYDLTRAPPTYDFLTFLLQAEMARKRGDYDALCIDIKPGPKNGFRADNLPPDLKTRQLMLEKVVKASVPLVGARLGRSGTVISHLRYMLKPIIDAAKQGEDIPMFRPSGKAWDRMASYDGAVVLSLRECDYWPDRNSRLENWILAAKELSRFGHRPVFVRDTAKAHEPIEGYETCPEASEDIDLRCALYQRAKYTLAASGGPCMLLYFGEKPYATFKQIVPGCGATSEKYWAQSTGMVRGEQYPWAKPDQRMSWLDDTVDALMAEIHARS